MTLPHTNTSVTNKGFLCILLNIQVVLMQACKILGVFTTKKWNAWTLNFYQFFLFTHYNNGGFLYSVFPIYCASHIITLAGRCCSTYILFEVLHSGAYIPNSCGLYTLRSYHNTIQLKILFWAFLTPFLFSACSVYTYNIL